MATASAAIVEFGKSVSGAAGARNGKIKVRRLGAAPSTAAENRIARRKIILKKILFWSAFSALFCLSGLAVAFYYFYSQAAQIVEQRVRLGFWQTRSGIYAAPHLLKTGQKITAAELVAILRHAGYVEGESRNIWNGNFTVKGDTILIGTNQTPGDSPEIVSVEITGERIAAIETGDRALDQYELQPEMISGLTETKRGSINTLKFEQIPDVLRNAILVTEDRRFFEHAGLDYRAVLRALRRNISENRIAEGGSTVTQQFVKNIFLSGERTFSRKFSELFLALALENQLSKEEIFALYCNEIYLGQYGAAGIHGVEQASRAYFGKAVQNLTPAEAATLAAMIKSPRHYAPNRNYQASKARRNLVIEKMLEEGLLAPTEARQAQTEEIALAPPQKNIQSLAPYFVDAAAKQIEGLDLPERNLRVYTTIDPQLQEIAEKSVGEKLRGLDKTYAKKGLTPQAALVALNPQNGHVLALVGGRDYAVSQLNRAIDARRQPGSTFKPFVYAAALESGQLPTSVVSDRPTEFAFDRNKPYKPANYGNSYAMGEITLKTALAKSSNVAAVEIALETGLGHVSRAAEKFGLPKPPAYPSAALGTGEVAPLELAAAYAAFANGGRRVQPVFVSRILSGEGNAIYENKNENRAVVSPQTAYMITDMLGAAVERGTARAAFGALGKNAVFVGKTGSSKDGWFVGYTPNLVCLVWIGFDEGDEDIGLTGGESALPVWVDFMRAATEARPEFGGAEFPMPDGLIQVEIDPETGMLADRDCPQREKVVVPTKSFSNFHCLRHRPKTEILYAGNSAESTFAAEPNAADYEISSNDSSPAANVNEYLRDETTQSNDAETEPARYKSINGVPFAHERNTNKISPSKRTGDSEINDKNTDSGDTDADAEEGGKESVIKNGDRSLPTVRATTVKGAVSFQK